MAKRGRRIAVFPGTFDPLTNGHLDVIQRAARLFDELVVAVGQNPEKPSLMTQAQRAAVIRKVVRRMGNVRVESYDGLTVDFVKAIRASVMIRGIRNGADLAFELQVALTNRAAAGVETVFIIPLPQHGFISSTLVRQIARGGGDVSSMVPKEVLPHLAGLRRRPRRTA
ncbi:MAG: pantetheine-phosphate adenylyltransferase [Phycisphaerae bacterium]